MILWCAALTAGVAHSLAKQPYIPPLPVLLERNPLVIVGAVQAIGKHQDPDLNNSYDNVSIRIEKILKHTPIENNYLDKKLVVGEMIPIMFGVELKDKYHIGLKGIWIARYYNNIFWLDDPEVYRPLEKEAEIISIVRSQLVISLKSGK
jgi:hypothetical protein